MTQRLDITLVDLNLASTRSQAQQLIKEGVVTVDSKIIRKPSFQIEGKEEILVNKEKLFVGRGAHKIEGALKDFSIDVTGMSVADIGASTGGFTEYVLLKGAAKVFAVDVGHGQLAEKLRNDSRVINREGTNVREVWDLGEKVDLVVADLSFISLKLVLKNMFSFLHDNGEAVVLFKPQFEVGPDNLGKGGIVKSQEAVIESLRSLFFWCQENSIYISGFSLCSIKGKTGNQEFFFHIKKNLKGHAINIEELI